MTADISSKVAENSVCWCEGRNRRRARENRPARAEIGLGDASIGKPILHAASLFARTEGGRGSPQQQRFRHAKQGIGFSATRSGDCSYAQYLQSHTAVKFLTELAELQRPSLCTRLHLSSRSSHAPERGCQLTGRRPPRSYLRIYLAEWYPRPGFVRSSRQHWRSRHVWPARASSQTSPCKRTVWHCRHADTRPHPYRRPSWLRL